MASSRSEHPGALSAASGAPPEKLGRRQLVALLRKHLLVKRRGYGQTLCELLSPIILAALFIIGWQLSLANLTHQPARIYANQSLPLGQVFNLVVGGQT